MIERGTIVVNPTGLHARPAVQFAACAKKYKSKIMIRQADGNPVNAKSIVMLLSCGLHLGDKAIIIAEGEDENEAADTLIKLIESGFGE